MTERPSRLRSKKELCIRKHRGRKRGKEPGKVGFHSTGILVLHNHNYPDHTLPIAFNYKEHRSLVFQKAVNTLYGQAYFKPCRFTDPDVVHVE